MRVNLYWRVLPVHILIAIFLALPLWQRHEAALNVQQAASLAQAKLSASHAPTNIEGTPARIVIPQVAVDVSIVPQTYSQTMKTWPVAPDTANYATNTVKANNNAGLTFIYGHWTSKVFGPTKQLKDGDVAYIYTDNNHVFKYVFSAKKIVQPSDIQAVTDAKGKPGLILMTCDGNWAQVRRLMFFNLVDAR